MNYPTKLPDAGKIFNVTKENFPGQAIQVFNYQWEHNDVYRQYCNQLQIDPAAITRVKQVPFLPIALFKTHRIAAYDGDSEIIFTSSGTTGSATSRHFVRYLQLYEQSFTACFSHFYGNPSNHAFLCLLPSYLEREGSSLILMAERLIQLSGKTDSGFFLRSKGKLTDILLKREQDQQPTFLLGVTYALLDFAAEVNCKLKHTIIMETGGMKGRRQELTRADVHEQLRAAFGVPAIHSEYGMTELLSQAYSRGNGIFECPPWLKVLVREEDDPFTIKQVGAGLLCIVDLANMHSCSFIETADVGRVYDDGSFEVLGRMDNSDVRGCSLLVV